MSNGLHTNSSAVVSFTDALLKSLASIRSKPDLSKLMGAIAHEFGFRYFALIYHDDLRNDPADRVNIKNYPAAVVERIIDQATWRRDPIMRGCIFAEGAFLWSGLSSIIRIDRRDRDTMAFGARNGLNEGITIPCLLMGQCLGSCTFAGRQRPEHAQRVLGVAQMVEVFAFQAARRLTRGNLHVSAPPRLHPRPRDCVILAGQGRSNKEIARALSLTPRTVDGYLTEARRIFNAHDRTELVDSAVLAGEIGLHDLKIAQPE
mgnify:CR=1 FL=1